MTMIRFLSLGFSANWAMAHSFQQLLLGVVIQVFECVCREVAWEKPENNDFIRLGNFGNSFGRVGRRPFSNHVFQRGKPSLFNEDVNFRLQERASHLRALR